jgi:hypothetical protein
MIGKILVIVGKLVDVNLGSLVKTVSAFGLGLGDNLTVEESRGGFGQPVGRVRGRDTGGRGLGVQGRLLSPTGKGKGTRKEEQKQGRYR